MVDFKEENKKELVNLLIRFNENVNAPYNKDKTVEQLAESMINDQISMQKGMQDYYNHLKDEDDKNKLLLRGIRNQKGYTFYKHILDIIEESEGIKGLAEIVNTPTGKFQEEKRGRFIKGIWVEQWSVGMEGDSYNGNVCVELDKNKYLKFSYSM